MAADEEQLVVIERTWRPPEPPDRPWAGVLLVLVLPVALAMAVFAFFYAR